MGKEIKIISQSEQSILMHLYPAVTVQVSKYPSVFSQETVNITDKIICIPVQPVIIIIPALIGTKFLISTAMKNLAAIETFLFHSTKVLIKIKKNVFKRIQMTINDSDTCIND
jgi:hypothetical protein